MAGLNGLATLRLAVALGGLVPVSAGLAGALLGPGMLGTEILGAEILRAEILGAEILGAEIPAASLAVDSHYRYLSGLLLGIGLGFWSTLPDPLRHTSRFRLLTAIVVLGGLARLLGLVLRGAPGRPMLAALGMELVVTPLLCLWQARLAAPPAAA
ncbi:MAG: hypothetical protein JWP04_3989 [Belnapia sp.]|nr:hypothetical protein [Belnapia sp.]